MAESNLFDFPGHIISKLTDRALQEIGLWWGLNDEIEKLKSTVSRIRAVLLDAEEKQESNHEIKDWLGKLKEVVFEADDLIDDFATEALRRQVMDGNRVTKEVRVFFSSSNQFSYGWKMGRKIKDLRERLDGIDVERNKFNLETGLEEKGVVGNRLRDQTTSAIPEVVIGRDKDREKIVGLVLGSKNDKKVSVISIVGIGGLGKTTLAQLVFNDERVKSEFELKLWLCVSDPFDVKVIVKKILESAESSKVEDLELDTLKNQLDKCLEKKRFLLVLDDVWNEEGEKWDSLKSLLVSGAASGSKIIVTTRSQVVAKLASTLSTHIHVLEGLKDDESWSLFVEIALGGEEPKNKHVIEIGKEIVKKCSGVPLAIKTIGRVLFFKNPEIEWSPFLENELSKVPQNPTDILPTLKLSYDHLPSHLKHCFAYCSLFPKDYEIDVRTLIHLWISQGFVESNSDQCIEEKGLECFMEMTRRSFFQELKRDELGNVESCKMHDLMNDLANLVGGNESYIISSNKNNIDKKTRHVSFEFSLNPSLLNAKGLRTILLLSRVSSESSTTFSNCRCLRVLDLHHLWIENLSPFIKKKKHLRYLDVSKNIRIKSLPNSVTKLPNLEVLRLTDCYNIKELPGKIKRLINLRHLYIEGCENLTHMPKGIGELTSLQTLSLFLVAKDCGVSKHIASIKELGRLNELRGGIDIRNLEYVKRGELEPDDKILEGKKHVRFLILRWGVDDNCNSFCDESLLQNLQPHSNLEALEMAGCGCVRFPGWLSSLKNLKELTISGCNKCESLPPLDQLPFLKGLTIFRLPDLEFIESEEENCSSEGQRGAIVCPSLKKLEIISCPKLKGWRKRTNLPEFPCLSILEIRGCPKLSSIPLFPSLDGELVYEHSGIEPLLQTKNFKKISKQHGGEQVFTNLRKMSLEGLEDLEYLVIEEDGGKKGSTVYPFLKSLYIKNCQNMKGWWKMREWDNGRTTTTVTELPHFPSLFDMQIINCPKLSSMPLFPSLFTLSLENTNTEPLEQTLKMTAWGSSTLKMTSPLSQLHNLTIWYIEDLESLPTQGLQNLTSLKELRICGCSRLASLPQEMRHLTSLRLLLISRCHILKETCRENGVDWPQIKHIPSIEIDSQVIQSKETPIGGID